MRLSKILATERQAGLYDWRSEIVKKNRTYICDITFYPFISLLCCCCCCFSSAGMKKN